MLLSLTKKITSSHQEVRAGKWIRDANRGMELEGKTIGIIGFGHTGRAFAKKLAGFDVRILAYDKYNSTNIEGPVVRCADLGPVFEEADVVSFHVPLQEDTHHYFNDAFIGRMAKPFIVINTSRGAVADSRALLDGLTSGKVWGACLDVAEEEPLELMSPEARHVFNAIISLQQVVVTPHIAGYSHEALYKMSKALLRKIVTVG
jgi:D-3-phosphoglycerate dehydrogenase